MAGNSMRSKRMDISNDFFTRRDSIAVAGMEFQHELVEKLAELRSIWDEVGMNEDQRRDRMDTALNHLKSLLTEMVEEENCMRDTLQHSLDSSKKEIDTLLKQLRQPKPDFLQCGSFTLLELEEKCRILKQDLMEERDSRIRDRDSLLAEYTQYSARVDAPMHDFDLNTIPEKAALDALKYDVDRLKQQWHSNLRIYQEKRETIMKLAAKVQLDDTTLTPFQRHVFVEDALHRDTALVLSAKNMDALSELEQILQDQYNAYLEEIRERIGVVQFELTKWWDQCHVPSAERERFRTVDPESDPELAVKQYNGAIDYWRAFYESRKTVLDKIGEWERLWQEHVEFEERERDANRYNNRGGALLQEEKRRKKVQVLLPQVYKQLHVMVSDYDEAHPDTPFLMDNMPVMEYIDSIEREYQEKKRKEKEEKEMLKKQQLMTERMYGAMPNTPGSQRKRVGSSASNTPSKQISPSKKTQSKVYIHSSLAPRSPMTNKTSQVAPGSGNQKPPTGLPNRAQSVKRKVLLEQQGEPDNQHIVAGTAEGHSVLSTGSYGEFANNLRARGLEGQSSFIGPLGRNSPTKMPRLH